MKKVISYTAISFLTAFFILSSSGIYLAKHYCTAGSITELFFFKPPSEEPCEHHKSDLTGNDSPCNSKTLIYLVIEDTFVKADQPGNLPVYNISDFPATRDCHFKNRYIKVSNHTIHDKAPPNHSGREIAFLNRALLL